MSKRSYVKQILEKKELGFEDIADLLSLSSNEEICELKKAAYETKLKYVGSKAYYRGLIEFSNICEKNCLYCGIRGANDAAKRYTMTEDEILEAAHFAHSNNYGSIVLQSGEKSSPRFVSFVKKVLRRINEECRGELGVTLCVGEQSKSAYKAFKDAGAHRYLLRVETSSKSLYEKLHPSDDLHSFENRIESLKTLQSLGYQTGTGVMIGLPFQTVEDLARDLLFFRDFDIDMVGMGPYIGHEDTPLAIYESELLSEKERRDLTLKMISILRIMMKDINIASTTALQALDPKGREKGLQAGANVLMPNITPAQYREEYFLYDNKPCVNDSPTDCRSCLEARVKSVGEEVGYGEWGDSPHFFNKTGKSEEDIESIAQKTV